jgi:small subunit ribosomal protein S21
LVPAELFRGGDVADIQLRDDQSVEQALKLFRRKLLKEGLFKELRRRRHYLKPSAARSLKDAQAQRRKRKQVRLAQLAR